MRHSFCAIIGLSFQKLNSISLFLLFISSELIISKDKFVHQIICILLLKKKKKDHIVMMIKSTTFNKIGTKGIVVN